MYLYCSAGANTKRRTAMCGTNPDCSWIDEEDEERSWLGKILDKIPFRLLHAVIVILGLLFFLIVALCLRN